MPWGGRGAARTPPPPAASGDPGPTDAGPDDEAAQRTSFPGGLPQRTQVCLVLREQHSSRRTRAARPFACRLPDPFSRTADRIPLPPTVGAGRLPVARSAERPHDRKETA
ncbi:hypothetical protein TPA0906_73960 [Streptomyces olivaceus]|nr:hypothetical protein TPA0906_73960 [Streptomyces olivaceus]